jgi:hypothetical protein
VAMRRPMNPVPPVKKIRTYASRARCRVDRSD